MSSLALVRRRASCQALAVRCGLAAALGVVVVLGSSELASASCGRYVIFQGSTTGMSPHGPAMTPADMESQPLPPLQQWPAPCDGPQCGGRDWLPPLTPPASPLPTGHEQNAWLGDTALLKLSGRGQWAEAREESPRAGHRSPLERPPRS